MGLNESVLAMNFRRSPKKIASMSNTKDMSVSVRKKGLSLTFTGSKEAQCINLKMLMKEEEKTVL